MKNTFKKYYLVGWEFNDPWENVEIYSDDKDDILHTSDTFEYAPTFDYKEAILLKQYLQTNYNDITWYLMQTN